MSFFLPDLSLGKMDSHDLAIRRYLDLYLAVYDHYDHVDELKHEELHTDTLAGVIYDADCGYKLRLEFRVRGARLQTGFTLMESFQHGFHMPALRLVRPIKGVWQGFMLNQTHASPEFQRFFASLGLNIDAKRHEFSDLAVNIIFGKCCQMLLYGFLKR
jgi:hypothetical protein